MRDQFLRLLEPVYSDLERHCHALCWADGRVSHKDLLQETLTQAFQRLKQLENEDAFKSWTFSIAIRCYRNERRKSFLKRTVTFGLSNDLSPGLQTVEQPPQHADVDLVERAMAKLKRSDREVLALYYLSGCSIQEIADLSGDRSISATKSRLSRARMRMRMVIEDLGIVDSPRSTKLTTKEVTLEQSR
jgi:RNA polymerase sigma-70 factor (ECF subfamily)